MSSNNPIVTEKKNPSGLPHIDAIKVHLPSNARGWLQEAKDAVDIANDFIFNTYEETHPPAIIINGYDIFIPSFFVIADTLIRAMVEHTRCNAALVFLVCEKLDDIETLDPWAVAIDSAKNKAITCSSDSN